MAAMSVTTQKPSIGVHQGRSDRPCLGYTVCLKTSISPALPGVSENQHRSPAAREPCGGAAPPPHVARANWLWQGSGNNFRLTNLNARMRK